MRYTNTAATIYNAWKDPVTKRTVYRPTILRDVKWQSARASKLGVQGIAPGDGVSGLTTVIIWPSRLQDTQGRQYIAPKRYAKLPPEEVGRYWTLSDEEDRLVRGAIEGPEIVEKIEGITSMHDDALKVVAVSDNRFGPSSMRHWYVSGTGA